MSDATADDTVTPSTTETDCIIYVNAVNSPTGWWWAKRITDNQNDRAEVVISGGRVCFNDNGRPIKSDENNGLRPHVNFEEYPYNKYTLALVRKIHMHRKEIKQERNTYAAYREMHKDTMLHLARNGITSNK